MFQLIIQWLMSTIALIVIPHIVYGFEVTGFVPALIAAAVIGLLNATLGTVLKVITFPVVILTFGVFIFVINALMIIMASKVVDGFIIYGFKPAIWGSIVLTVINFTFRMAFQKA